MVLANTHQRQSPDMCPANHRRTWAKPDTPACSVQTLLMAPSPCFLNILHLSIQSSSFADVQALWRKSASPWDRCCEAMPVHGQLPPLINGMLTCIAWRDWAAWCRWSQLAAPKRDTRVCLPAKKWRLIKSKDINWRYKRFLLWT